MIKKTTKLEENVHELVFKDRSKLYIIGTAHVSKESARLVAEKIGKIQPERVFLELDERRKQALEEKGFQDIDLKKIIRLKQGYFFTAYLLLSLFQRKIARDLGTEPGIELKTALLEAKKLRKKHPDRGFVELIDRPADITLKRLWNSMGFWKKSLLIFTGIASLFSVGGGEKVDTSDEKLIEELKQDDKLHSLLLDLGKSFPRVKYVLIDERDEYMVEKILLSQKAKAFKKALLVAGAGHVPGMLAYFQKREKALLASSLLEEKYHAIKKPSWFSKVLIWIIPGFILSIFALGFFKADYTVLREALFFWVLANGCFCALGAIMAGAKPITVFIAFLAAPITSLNPSIGAGMVTALVEIWVTPPRLNDFETLQNSFQKLGHFKAWRANRITKILLVFIFCSIGSAIGTFAALPFLLKIFA